jgi:nucleoside-diphosphate-sugar epimerase
MRVLLAGGAGLIGSHMCDALVDRGDSVVVVDNFCSGSAWNLAHLEGSAGFELVCADVTEPLPSLGDFDAVVNLACPASPADFERLSLEIMAVGSDGTRNLLEVARHGGARFLQASTSEVYGEPAVHPQVESYWGNVNPTGPRSVYDESKRFAEALTMAYCRRYGLQVRIARIFNTYGPRLRPDDGRVVSNFCVQALQGEPLTLHGDGGQSRSFCYVTDLVDGLLALLEGPVTGPVNLGNPDEFSVAELATLVGELVVERGYRPVGIRHVERPADDPSQRQPDISLAVEALGWKPSTPLRQGLARTLDYFAAELAGEAAKG